MKTGLQPCTFYAVSPAANAQCKQSYNKEEEAILMQDGHEGHLTEAWLYATI